jgi:tetratricopeptide (TPR) repeat protein
MYRYLTAFVVVASPLFFIPGTSLAPDSTYYLVMIAVIALALTSYVISAILTKSWHQVTRFEVLAYGLFSVAVLLSAMFAENPKAVLFGNEINHFSALSLLALPAVVYLVRSLPEDFRKRVKRILAGVLFVATFFFLFSFIFQGELSAQFARVFSVFTSPLSLIVYLGIFVITVLGYIRKIEIHSKYKAAVLTTGLIVVSLLMSLASQGDIRPNFRSSLAVASDVLEEKGAAGIFGIGAGDFTRAWQLHRPQAVINSPYFDVEFRQGSGTIPTFFTTIGFFGGAIFILFMLGALYLTYRTYKKEEAGEDKHISGILALIQAYLFIAAWVIPFSFPILVLWMVIVGFGLAKARLNEFHPNKIMLFVAAPLAILLVAQATAVFTKTKAVLVFAKAQTMTSATPEQLAPIFDKAISIAPLDVFYRAKLENAINASRIIVASQQSDQKELETKFMEQADVAVKAGLDAVNANPYNYQNYVALGRAQELALPFDKQGAYERAKKSYEKAIALYPDNPYLYVMMARLEAAGGSKEAVRLSLNDALKKKENFLDALYLMSQLEASESQVDEAIKYAVKAVEVAPKDSAALVQAGLLYYGKKDYQNAVTYLYAALQVEPTNNNIAYFLALSLRDGGALNDAKLIAEELLRRNPGNAEITALLKSLEPKETAKTK